MSPERIDLEIVEGFHACVESNAMQVKRYRVNFRAVIEQFRPKSLKRNGVG